MVNIIGHRKINLGMSLVLFVISVAALSVFGLKPGIDFSGGSLLEVRFTETVPNQVDAFAALTDLKLESLAVQTTGDNGLLLRTKFLTESEHQELLGALRAKFEKENNKVMEISFQTIGPAISSQLKQRTVYAIIAVLLGIIVYIAYTFRRVSKPVASWKYGLVAIVAVAHDVIITMGVFAVLGRFLGVEVDIPFTVALLTILGYSVNDTIVVFDRIRENLIRQSSDDFSGTVNFAINQTFARSINTTATTLFTLLALFLFGGDTIKFFSLALLVGIFLGAYSSIFVASPLLVEVFNWQNRKRS
ncbi:MAG: protein-export membrane protein SecF [Candidatus Magasanikbacteria bacterium RIFCSPLOWO2_12_FULL_43_12]|uniref:Protein-export membrane protein SecF n=1 Tax=Candidatus Magasanikbacteria bacterium RIFCSPLOWO2_12_FULL_43_12 TaxID=1798692 RepID=A0A1F6MVT0_9BACT|nr:MAG: protein-export membrane protein SecF [Candidatus Magasanikbacteria bacterium RIFCSPLOWO2_12_FULL_43_12]